MKKTIFIVDDSDSNLSLARDALKGHYKVLTMASSEKMFSLLEKIRADIILLDVEMPEMGGFEAIGRLKKDFGEIPVIFLTSHRDAGTEAKCFEFGAVDFVSKPFKAEGLLKRVQTQIKIMEITGDGGMF